MFLNIFMQVKIMFTIKLFKLSLFEVVKVIFLICLYEVPTFLLKFFKNFHILVFEINLVFSKFVIGTEISSKGT